MLQDYSLLRIPGPTPVPPSVQSALNKPIINHRSEKMNELIGRVKSELSDVFGGKEDFVILTGSGTAGLEAAVVNTVDHEDEVLIVVTGAFGERFSEICCANHIQVHLIEVPWGEAVALESIEEVLKNNPKIKAVFITHCETSTGVLNPLEAISRTIRKYSDALLIVDGVSSAIGVETKLHEWDIDVYVTSSQKAMMLPPGLAFIYMSKRAWEVTEQKSNKTRYYFDFRTYRNDIKNNNVPYTPAVSLLFGLEQALTLIRKEGLESIYHRHNLMMKMTRAAMKAMELPLLCNDTIASPTITAVKPTTFSPEQLREILDKQFNLILAGGQKKLKGKIFRIGHMGYCSPADVLQTISLIELGLIQLGKKEVLGQGVRAAQKIYLSDYNNKI